MKQDKARHEEALKGEKIKTQEAEKKLGLLHEKLERLIQLTKKQKESDDFISKIANLEKETTTYQTQISNLQAELTQEKNKVYRYTVSVSLNN